MGLLLFGELRWWTNPFGSTTYMDVLVSREAWMPRATSPWGRRPSWLRLFYSFGRVKRNFYDPVLATAVQSADGNSVTNLSETALENNFSGLVSQYKNYLSNQTPDATVGQVLGALTVEQKTLSALPITLQSRIIAVGGRFANLPDTFARG